ncbi:MULTISPECIES: GNAT family N-acetyltransferase [unclassified Nocardioides]|uniref:GNAT family N-acetyltransferase n=1 Tax=unclassified Nocardioides TaxID=2615069 RepID=UPI00360EA286
MSDIKIVEVDPFDPDQLDPWHAAYLAAELAAGEGVGSPWQLEEVRALMQATVTKHWVQGYAGVVDGEVVSSGWVRTPLLDNVERAEMVVHTVPAHRRRGYGTAMLEHLEQVAAERDRTILVGEAAWRFDAGPSGSGEPGVEFAGARGFELALGDVKRTLALPADEAVLEALAAGAAEKHAGYTLRSFVGPVPDDLLDGWSRLSAELLTEAPTGALDVEAESTDPVVVRENEEILARQGRTKYNTVALAPDGELVAFTDIATTVHEPGRAYQWGTLVRRDARGHRLGLAVKVANLRLLQSEAPDITVLTTYNAEVNRHMIEVNERLGFTPVARLGEFQKRF